MSSDLYVDVRQIPADVTTANIQGLGVSAPREASKLASAVQHSSSFTIQKSLDEKVCNSMSHVGACLSSGGQIGALVVWRRTGTGEGLKRLMCKLYRR